MIAFVVAHPLIAIFALYWLFSAFVSGMPEPSPISSLAYHWLFTSLNAFAANIADLIRLRYPRIPLPPSEAAPPNPSHGRLLPFQQPVPPDNQKPL